MGLLFEKLAPWEAASVQVAGILSRCNQCGWCGQMKRNTPDDIRRLSDLYREIHAQETRLKSTALEFEALVRDVANRMGVSVNRVGELIAESHASQP